MLRWVDRQTFLLKSSCDLTIGNYLPVSKKGVCHDIVLKDRQNFCISRKLVSQTSSLPLELKNSSTTTPSSFSNKKSKCNSQKFLLVIIAALGFVAANPAIILPACDDCSVCLNSCVASCNSPTTPEEGKAQCLTQCCPACVGGAKVCSDPCTLP
ncbi:hypothetical protein L873DRAFT_744139 [Choiromyces venosus 120613-1]|uniref:Uncharacterized protein n=1 Tax=Choiromyces venosus 120613-1 TaxID=1336337 RepID=A0A3N4JR82_9PEZI|nr:hypothetical protein L873DRAFT_744139 [Choiromyces venosus 120613-1]